MSLLSGHHAPRARGETSERSSQSEGLRGGGGRGAGGHSWRACLESQLINHAGLLQPRREITCLAEPGGELEPRNTRGSEPREQLPHLPGPTGGPSSLGRYLPPQPPSPSAQGWPPLLLATPHPVI